MNIPLSGRLGGVLKRFTFLLASGLFLAGCGLQGEPKLDAADLRFAAFYGDYLSRSGISPKEGEAPTPALTSAGLDTLYARHGMDQKTFDAKLRVYSQDPQRWRKVLEQVRKNLSRGR
ncbi:MAG: DUF4296 domain-containing protein [Chlorobiaceae bacterium]|nr:DUF4296 domain-containing protein [Chlorobiaceae bacterium]